MFFEILRKLAYPSHNRSMYVTIIKNFAKNNNMILQAHTEIGQSIIQLDPIIREAEKKRLLRDVEFSLSIGARCLTLHIGKPTCGSGHAYQ